jgi:DNA primase
MTTTGTNTTTRGARAADGKPAEAREAQLAALHHRLTEQVHALRTGADWAAWLTLAARFHTYSANNTLLIWAQRPDATHVAGYRTWQTLGRHVNKGEHGLQILAPVHRPTTARHVDDETDQPRTAKPTGANRRSLGSRDSRAVAAAGPEPPPAAGHPGHTAPVDAPAGARSPASIVGYRLAHVWDITQTSGQPLPEPPTPQLLHGQAPDGLWDALASQVTAAGFTLTRGSCGSANGLTDFRTNTVTLRADVDDAQAVKTLAHELGHVLLHNPASGEPLVECRAVAEVEAESVAYLLTAAHGLPSDAYTFPYVTTWATQPAPPHESSNAPARTPEQVVLAVAARVQTTAARVLTGTQHLIPLDPPPAHAAQAALPGPDLPATARANITPSRAAKPAQAALAHAPLGDGGDRAAVSGRLLAVHAAAAEFYTHQLHRSWVPAYLQRRALDAALDPDCPWQVGYAPKAWTALVDHLHDAGYPDTVLEASGLAIRARTGHLVDRFRDRLTLPITDPTGHVIAFLARAHPNAAPTTPRYLNSPTTDVYDKTHTLYGLAPATTAARAGAVPTLSEGPLDAIAIQTATGERCAPVALCGTALTPSQAHLIAQLSAAAQTTTPVVALDADTAGHAARENTYHQLRTLGLTPAAAALPEGTDPADLLRAAGPARLAAAVTATTHPLVDDLVQHRLEEWKPRLHWVEGRVGALRAVAPLIRDLPGNERARLRRHVVDVTGLDPSTVQRETRPPQEPSRLTTADLPPQLRASPGRQPHAGWTA